MSWNLRTYSLNPYTFYKKAFSDEEIETIKNLIGNNNLQNGTVGNTSGNVEKEIRDSKVFFITPSDESEWLYRKLTDLILHMNEQFYGFDLEQIETLQFTKYTEGQFYVKHIDTINSFIGKPRKLSFSVQLSDPSEYDGGDLYLHEACKPIVVDKEKGIINFFPSFMLHEVTPVTRGVRESLVGWITGPWFK